MLRGCFGKSGQPTSVLQGAVGATYTYNAFGQMSQTAVGANSSGTVSPVVTYVPGYERFFVNGVYSASNRITSWTVTNGGSSTAYAYTYDTRSNITSASDGTHTTTYVYDGKDQLTRENNQAAGKTWVYTYDNGGNILSKTEYAYTTGTLGTPLDTITYTYGDSTWGDLLTAYDGQTLTSDEIGNLTSDGTWSYTWQHARQLAGMTDGTTSLSFAYNADGQRVSKTVGGTTYNYTYANGVLTHMQWGSNSLHFVYDALGAAAVIYNGTTYYYLRNAQGDITGIVNSSGYKMVAYTYDAWGNPISVVGPMASTLGTYNPLRYRGYFYDTETGLYYLTSRYYNPSWGRFISLDNQLSTGSDFSGANLFAYCGNNPVNRVDPTGEAWWHWAIGAAIVVGFAVATVATCGGFAAAALAVGMVGSGVAAASTGATIAAAGFIGSATVLGLAACTAAVESNSVQEFNDRGNWETVAATAVGGIVGGAAGYTMATSTPSASTDVQGFDSFSRLKREVGSPGVGKQWHHIVEQSQINKSGFSPQMIHNTGNIVAVTKTVHQAISGYYSSIQPFTNGMIVRNWLAGQSFADQYAFGISILQLFS